MLWTPLNIKSIDLPDFKLDVNIEVVVTPRIALGQNVFSSVSLAPTEDCSFLQNLLCFPTQLPHEVPCPTAWLRSLSIARVRLGRIKTSQRLRMFNRQCQQWSANKYALQAFPFEGSKKLRRGGWGVEKRGGGRWRGQKARVQKIIRKKVLMVIVVCPLKSIVHDQISEASSMGLNTVALPVNPTSSSGSVACTMLPELRYPSNSLEIALRIPFLSSEAISWCLKRSFEAACQFPWAIHLPVFLSSSPRRFSPLHSRLDSSTQLPLEVLCGENHWYSELTEIRPV